MLNDVSHQFLIHVDLPVIAIVLSTGRSFLPLPQNGIAPKWNIRIDTIVGFVLWLE